MSKDTILLWEIFNENYKRAKRLESEGNTAQAAAQLVAAANVMLEIAHKSDEAQKKDCMVRVKGLVAYAESLKTNKPSKSEGVAAGANQQEEGKWTSEQIPDIGFDDIAGLDNVKDAVRMLMINPRLHSELYKTYNKKTGGGLLLYGPPGTGKTMIARAIAHEVGARFYLVKCSDILSKWVGDSEKNIKSLFESVNTGELAIIFFDELEGLFFERGKDIHSDKRLSELLQQIDGFVGRNPNLLLLGATNRPWDIDAAARRPGRFNQIIYVPLPDERAREFLIERSLKGVPLSEDFDIAAIVTKTAGYSGADIGELCDRAKDKPLKNAISTGVIRPICNEDFDYAFAAVRPSVDKKALERFERFGRESDA